MVNIAVLGHNKPHTTASKVVLQHITAPCHHGPACVACSSWPPHTPLPAPPHHQPTRRHLTLELGAGLLSRPPSVLGSTFWPVYCSVQQDRAVQITTLLRLPVWLILNACWS